MDPFNSPTDRHQARKRFGQNFLQDKNLLNKIARSIHPTPQDHIIEIGPGQGALTQYIIDNVASLDVIEIDRDLVTYLKKHFRLKPTTLAAPSARSTRKSSPPPTRACYP